MRVCRSGAGRSPRRLAAADPWRNPLERELGRAEVRVYAAPFCPAVGQTLEGAALVERLEPLSYRRVSGRPTEPGTYFWGNEVFWVYRRPFRRAGKEQPAALFGLRLRGDQIREVEVAEPRNGRAAGLACLEPEVIAESLTADRSPRRPVALAELPERVWRPVLAAEDARFFEHSGVDARSIARALLKNALAGKVTQGGSTITQQLVKGRDLTPKRTLGRKMSEAVRALALEAEYSKEEILETYLNHVYFGHVDGVAIHGIGAAARAFFSKTPRELGLDEAALLAGIIQSPNRLSPLRHLEAARKRQNWVLGRVEELKWASAEELRRARAQAPRLKPRPPEPPLAPHLVTWMAEEAKPLLGGSGDGPKGVVIETTLDPHLQRLAERAVASGLQRLRRDSDRRRLAPLGAALVALDPESGAVLAHVGGDPAAGAGFDRARSARRQPGSTIKPFVLLEAFDGCGGEDPLTPATRVRDAPLRIDLRDGPWEPQNFDGRFRGVVTLRQTLTESLNVPLVRTARHCGFGAVASRLERAGLEVPEGRPPSFVLGAIEATPLELAGAYTVFAAAGRAAEPLAVTHMETPAGVSLHWGRERSRQAASAEAAYLVRHLMRSAAESGTARAAHLPGVDVGAKTGSSSGERDAWLAGDAGSVVAVVWVGLDDGKPLGLSGAQAAAPMWREFMAAAAPARPPHPIEPPDDIVSAWIDPFTGRRLLRERRGAYEELFREGALPPRRRWFRASPLPVIE